MPAYAGKTVAGDGRRAPRGGGAQGQRTFNCSGAGCNLAASTSYFIVIENGFGNLKSTGSENETLQPSGNGWSIANGARTVRLAGRRVPATTRSAGLGANVRGQPNRRIRRDDDARPPLQGEEPRCRSASRPHAEVNGRGGRPRRCA